MTCTLPPKTISCRNFKFVLQLVEMTETEHRNCILKEKEKESNRRKADFCRHLSNSVALAEQIQARKAAIFLSSRATQSPSGRCR